MALSYRLLTHHKGDTGFHEQGSLVTEDDLGADALQGLLEHGCAEAYDPESGRAVALSDSLVLRIKDDTINQLRAKVAERDEAIRQRDRVIERLKPSGD